MNWRGWRNSEGGPFWSAGGFDNYMGRPDGLSVDSVCTSGTCAADLSCRAQMVATVGPVFHVHRVDCRENESTEDRHRRLTVPIASCDFGPDPDKNEVLRWARMVVEISGAQTSERLAVLKRARG